MSKLVSIAGDSGAGKTTLLNFFKNYFGDKVSLIEGDGYHKWERNDPRWQKFTPLNPQANRLEDAAEDLWTLKNMGPDDKMYIQEYNHKTGTFDVTCFGKTDLIVFAGLHSLYTKELRALSDIKVYINTDDELRKFWKFRRDISERGKTLDSAQEDWSKRYIDSLKYIKPQLLYADVIINIFSENVDLEYFAENPKVYMEVDIKKELIYKDEILHILKNLNTKIEEDEKFIKVQVYELF